MKGLCSLILTLPLVAGEPEETAWYDAEGKVVVVEAAGAESAKVPFVAEWRKREIERREASGAQWSSEMAPVWGGGYWGRRSYRSRGYLGYGGYYSGIRVTGRHFGGYYRSCPSGHGGGASVVIRW
jgi:hypothetical protein